MKNDFMKILESFVFNQIDEEVLKSEVKQLQDEYSEISSYELCDVLITKTSVSAAISGGITGGIPWPLNLLFAVPDFLLLLFVDHLFVLIDYPFPRVVFSHVIPAVLSHLFLCYRIV